MIGVYFTNGDKVLYQNAVGYEYKGDMQLFILATGTNKRIMIPRENVLDIGFVKEPIEGEFLYE